MSVKLIGLNAENFKRLRVVHLEVRDGVTVVAGNNGAGKSSVLDALAAALGGGKQVPDQPIRKGAKKAQVVVETSTVKVTRTFTESGGTLKVEGKDGAQLKSPQQVLDALIGDLSFDPLGFARMKPAEQVAALKKAAGLEAQFADLDKERSEAEALRRDVGRERDRLNAVVKSMAVLDPDAKPVDTAQVLADLNTARTRVQENETGRKALAEVRKRVDDLSRRRADIMGEIAELHSELQDVSGKIDRGADWISTQGAAIEALIDPDVRGLEQKLADAGTINQRAQQAEQARKTKEEAGKAEKDYATLTRKLEDIAEDKETLLRSSKLPIKGLSFTDEALTLNGIPFSQASTSEQIRASVAVAMAQNPELKLMLVRDGSLLDGAAMTELAALAAEHGAQVIVERVGTDAGGMGVVIKDGEVAQ